MEEREKELQAIIQSENLKEEETRKFIEDSFKNGEIKTSGTDIDKLMPPVSRFGSGKRAEKKQTIIDKLKAFFERFFGIAGSSFQETEDEYRYDTEETEALRAAEPVTEYRTE